MNTCSWLERRKGVVAAVILIAALGSNAAAAASPESCDLSLTVQLAPAVPDASDAGFLSSLLNNHTSYRLTLRQQRSSTLVDLDLTGVAVVATPLSSEEQSGTHLSADGIGSLYWAARHPPQAWRVLLPIFSGDSSGASANVRPSCVAFPEPTEEAPCG